MNDMVAELAQENGLADREMLEARARVLKALRAEFEEVDNGVGGGQCDFWVRHGDVEYKLVMSPVRTFQKPQ